MNHPVADSLLMIESITDRLPRRLSTNAKRERDGRFDRRSVAARARTSRAANVNDVVARSISGHRTEKMQAHYSTVVGAEQQRSLGRRWTRKKPGRGASLTG
jgi:hypothetical protein